MILHDAERDTISNAKSGFRPLAQHWRALLLAAPFVYGTFFITANVAIPGIWQHAFLKNLLLKPCALRTATGIPCPSCGATRATVLASKGRWLQSLRLNPVGVFLVVGGGLLALWCTACAISGRDLGLSKTASSVLRNITPRRVLLLVVLLWLYTIVANFKR